MEPHRGGVGEEGGDMGFLGEDKGLLSLSPRGTSKGPQDVETVLDKFPPDNSPLDSSLRTISLHGQFSPDSSPRTFPTQKIVYQSFTLGHFPPENFPLDNSLLDTLTFRNFEFLKMVPGMTYSRNLMRKK